MLQTLMCKVAVSGLLPSSRLPDLWLKQRTLALVYLGNKGVSQPSHECPGALKVWPAYPACAFPLHGALGSPAELRGEGSPLTQRGGHLPSQIPVLSQGGGMDTAWESLFGFQLMHDTRGHNNISERKTSFLYCSVKDKVCGFSFFRSCVCDCRGQDGSAMSLGLCS